MTTFYIKDNNGRILLHDTDKERIENTVLISAEPDYSGYEIKETEQALENCLIVGTAEWVTWKNESIRLVRESLYKEQVDPITNHIQRLRDVEPEGQEIEALIAHRDKKVAEIKEQYPYVE